VLVGDAAGPVTLETVLERLGLADPVVALALDVGDQLIYPLQDLAVAGCIRPARSPGRCQRRAVSGAGSLLASGRSSIFRAGEQDGRGAARAG